MSNEKKWKRKRMVLLVGAMALPKTQNLKALQFLKALISLQY
jgi:hypothetical protein